MILDARIMIGWIDEKEADDVHQTDDEINMNEDNPEIARSARISNARILK